MERNEWLSSLAEGSEVLITSNWVKPRLAKVDRVTKTMVMVGSTRFNRQTGRQICDDRWGANQLQQVTDEFRELHNRAALKEKILGALDSATTEELAQINVILTKERP